MSDIQLAQYAVAGACGVALGAGEILSRYKDAPWRSLIIPPAVGYLLINAMAAVAALYLMAEFEMRLDGQSAWLKEALLAGFGAAAMFRTSIFTARVGDTDVAIGPAFLLQTILATADRSIDRSRAEYRAAMIGRIMEGVRFDKAQVALPSYCFLLMQNVPLAEQQEVGKELEKLVAAAMDDAVKARALGLLLVRVVGERGLQKAVQTLGDAIR